MRDDERKIEWCRRSRNRGLFPVYLDIYLREDAFSISASGKEYKGRSHTYVVENRDKIPLARHDIAKYLQQPESLIWPGTLIQPD